MVQVCGCIWDMVRVGVPRVANILHTSTGDIMTTAAQKANPILAKHGFTFMSKQYTPLDIANDAVKVKKATDKADAEKSILGSKFVAMAKTCTSVADFLELCGEIERIKKWKSEQNPDGSKSAKDEAPAYVQYKSNVKVAWSDFGISPKDYDSTGTLNKKLNDARKAKKAKDNEANGEAQLTETVERAAEVDQKLAAILDKFTKLYSECDADSQAIVLDELTECYNGIVAGSEQAIAGMLEHKPQTDKAAKQASH